VRGALIWLAVLGAAVDASGQPANGSGKSEAATLFEHGRALIKAGKIDEACPVFAKSYELERAVGTELNLADCHERLGHFAEAWRLFDDAANQSERDGKSARQGVARDRASALLPKLGTLVIEVVEPNEPGLELAISAAAITPAAQLDRKVDPGWVVVSAHVPDHPAFETRVRVDATKTVVVKIPPFHPAAVAPSPIAVAAVEPAHTRRARDRVILAGVTGGLGVAATAVSVVVAVDAHSLYRKQFDNGNCTSSASYSTVCNSAGAGQVNAAAHDANIATGIGIAGLVLVAGGAVLYFTAPRELVIAPTATPTSTGVVLVGSF